MHSVRELRYKKAQMALTYTVVKRNVVGAQREVTADILFDNSYPTGGELFQPSDIGGPSTSVFHNVSFTQNNATPGVNRLFAYDYTNKKILIFTALGTEAINASDQSTITARVVCRFGQVTG